MRNLLLALICGIFIFWDIGCKASGKQIAANQSAAEPPPFQTPASENVESLAGLEVTELCKRLGEIKKLPYKDPKDMDPIYEELITREEDAIPCLIDEITNETPMHDPREAPVWQHYKVGDTAVFMLARIAKNDEILEEMLPPKYREEWRNSNGVYAYFNYVSESKHRKQLQNWWKEWMKKNIHK